VITEDDYTAYLSHMPIPTAFFPDFVQRSFLFLGCSLEDPNLRVLLHRLRKHKKGVPSWAIQFKASEAEKRLWEKRDVFVYDADINEFVHGLSVVNKRQLGS
jgi:hypothetical protein